MTLRASDGRSVDLYRMHVETDGSASAWLVTPMDLQDFNRVTIRTDDGVLATATLKPV